MTSKPMTIGPERELPPPPDEPGMRDTDDHVARPSPRGPHQPTDTLDPGTDDEHLKSPSQGVRPERPSPNPAA